MEKELLDKLDQFRKGTLSKEEQDSLLQSIESDADVKRVAGEHIAFIELLRESGERGRIKKLLDETHQELPNQEARITGSQTSTWAWIGIAASVSLISVVATFFLTRTQESEFQLLRRDFNQIQQSQKKMLKDINETKKKITPSPGNYAGSGFLISSNGYLATSYHVVRDADSVLVENEKFGLRKASVVFSDPDRDVSILKIEGEDVPLLPYVLSVAEAGVAEGVYTLGYPREEVVFGEGFISALTGYKEDENAYQISVPVNPGNSGGPLLNSKGDLVGMISGVQTHALGASFAVKSSVLLDVVHSPQLDTLSNSIMLPKINMLPSSDRVKQVKRWKEFVFMVRVYKN